MGQVLRSCATTTEAIRRAIQNSQESLKALSKRYGINQKTVANWKKRARRRSHAAAEHTHAGSQSARASGKSP